MKQQKLGSEPAKEWEGTPNYYIHMYNKDMHQLTLEILTK